MADVWLAATAIICLYGRTGVSGLDYRVELKIKTKNENKKSVKGISKS